MNASTNELLFVWNNNNSEKYTDDQWYVTRIPPTVS